MDHSIARTLADGAWRKLAYVPFRPGIDVHWIFSGGEGEPEIAVLQYAPGARVPRHRHPGIELIYVLDGIQSDESGDYPAGTVVVNLPGKEHSVWSDAGCTVLIQWTLPVQIIEEESGSSG